MESEITEFASLDLVSETVNDLRLGTDEENASLFNLASELCVFGQEPVSGMDHGDSVLIRAKKGGQRDARGTQGKPASRRQTSFAT